MHIVWFKRDLRIDDHAALSQAAATGDVLPLYILEPELWQQADLSARQYEFLCECLTELNQQLTSLGQSLVIRVGDAVEVLKTLLHQYNIESIWSHQETWNYWTYQRDKDVAKWLKSQNIQWHQPVQNGVVRLLKDRDSWATHWHQYMHQPVLQAPKKLKSLNIDGDALPSSTTLGLKKDNCPLRQPGGHSFGLATLQSFFDHRGRFYSRDISSPARAFDSSSRLSPHLAFGTLSIREVYQYCEQTKQQLKTHKTEANGYWLRSLQAFSSRLRWHCHFIQKLESEPEVEYRNMHPAYDRLREQDFNDEYFLAWQQGKTGYPMIDACMRQLKQTGWLNFRMRAMLVSFASYHLWLHWQPTAHFLARQFVDYEPGIHYPQIQMQSGTTGINSIRIYNPIKQGIDQDPNGDYIRQWIPELCDMPTAAIHRPWIQADFLNDYPLPIIDEAQARKQAADNIHQIRQQVGHKYLANAVVKKHGSRKKTSKKTQTKETNSAQQSFAF